MSNEEDQSNFDCNICLSTCSEPVLTQCGHLYCWQCLYPWMQGSQQGANECPVCKAGISVDNVIPMYGRGKPKRKNAAAPSSSSTSPSNSASTASAESSSEAGESSASAAAASSSASSSEQSQQQKEEEGEGQEIPDRPRPNPPPPPPRNNGFWGNGNGGGVQFSPFGFHAAGGNVGFFTMGFGLVPSLLGLAWNWNQIAPTLGPDGRPEEQSTFGRIMLLVGVLVILMLIYS